MATTTDDFNRADTTDLGASWEGGYGSFGLMQIVGNRVRAVTTAVQARERNTAISPGADAFARATIASLSGTTQARLYLMTRMAAPSTQTWYESIVSRGAPHEAFLISSVNATRATLQSLSTGLTFVANDTVTLISAGTMVTVFQNSTGLLTASDSAVTAAGSVGMGLRSAGDVSEIEADDFFGGDLSSITLRPNGDGTTTSWTRVAASGTFADKIVDDPDSNDGDTSYVMAPNVTDSQMWVELDNMPSDFDMGVSASIKAAAKKVEGGVAGGADTVNLFVQIEQSDEATDVTAESLVCNVTDTANYTAFDRIVAPAGSQAKAIWDAARLKLRQDYTAVDAADTTAQIRVTAAEVLLYYVPLASVPTFPQFARPSTDTTRDNWEEDDGTTTSIFDQLDETSADDADYIRTGLTPTSDVYVTKLTSVTDPQVSTGHIVRYKYGKDASGGNQIDITVQLRQGYVNESSLGTLIAERVHNNVSSGWTLESYTLTESETNSISDYSNLYIRIIANKP